MQLSAARTLFPILQQRAYLITGAMAPASVRAVESTQRYLDRLAHDTLAAYPDVPGTVVATDTVRSLLARLFQVDVDEIALTEGASAAANLVVDLLSSTEGANVVVDEFTYPSSVFPWRIPPREHIEVRCVEARDGVITLEEIARHVDDRTLAISVSHVSAFEGFKHDLAALARLAHAHRSVLIVDGTQAAGAMPLNLHELGVDFYFAATLKWLLGTAGVGVLYVARKHLSRKPTRAGYMSMGSFETEGARFRSSAQRYELGFPNLLGLAYVQPGLELLLDIGLEKIQSHVQQLAGFCMTGLTERGFHVVTPTEPEHRHSVIAAYSPDAIPLWMTLRSQGIDVGVIPEKTSLRYPGCLFRVDPHFFNQRSDIDRMFEAIDRFQGR